jgi:hypothetical protein
MNVKKTYQRPSVTKVELRPEEAVITACKTVTGPSSVLCNTRPGCSNVQGS